MTAKAWRGVVMILWESNRARDLFLCDVLLQVFEAQFRLQNLKFRSFLTLGYSGGCFANRRILIRGLFRKTTLANLIIFIFNKNIRLRSLSSRAARLGHRQGKLFVIVETRYHARHGRTAYFVRGLLWTGATFDRNSCQYFIKLSSMRTPFEGIVSLFHWNEIAPLLLRGSLLL